MTDHTVRAQAATLGLAEDEQVIYRAAVELGQITHESLREHEFCQSAGIDSDRVGGALRLFVDRRLVTPVLGRPDQFEVVDPGLALDPWAQDLESRARVARVEIERLSKRHRRRENATPESFVEVIQDVERAKAEVSAAHLAAKREVLSMERAPYQGSPGDLGAEQAELMRAGVVHRVLYELCEVEARRSDIEPGIRGGEIARARADLPLRAFIVDRQIGFVPGRRGSFLVDPLVIVHEGSLLDAILETFETCWAGAVPLSPTSPTDASASELVSMLSAGYTDDGIARQLGVSRRTVQRRISALMREWGVQNRFQAGLVLSAHIGHER